LSNEALTPDIILGGEVERRRFDPRTALPFVNKSVSEETRRAYRRTLSEFFLFSGGRHPADISPADVMLWRDGLRTRRRKPATVAFKLAVVPSFFEHLRAAGVVALNLASTNGVIPCFFNLSLISSEITSVCGTPRAPT
jgi:hypothetical protein